MITPPYRRLLAETQVAIYEIKDDGARAVVIVTQHRRFNAAGVYATLAAFRESCEDTTITDPDSSLERDFTTTAGDRVHDDIVVAVAPVVGTVATLRRTLYFSGPSRPALTPAWVEAEVLPEAQATLASADALAQQYTRDGHIDVVVSRIHPVQGTREGVAQRLRDYVESIGGVAGVDCDSDEAVVLRMGENGGMDEIFEAQIRPMGRASVDVTFMYRMRASITSVTALFMQETAFDMYKAMPAMVAPVIAQITRDQTTL